MGLVNPKDEDLEVLWHNFKLTAEEEGEVVLDDPVDSLVQKQSELCLVSKVLTERPHSFKVVKETMMAA